ncbi:hypothetical protein Golomagni_06418, partial [Golovinomyces magnicellulatus]
MSRPSSSRSSPTPSDTVFPDPPTANISAVAFSPTPSTSTSILVASWDHGVHHYRLDEGGAVKVQTFAHEAPVLDVCFVSDTIAASAGVDRRVRLHDLDAGKTMVVGKHDDAVLKLRWCAKTQLLVSGSSDRTLRFWDVHGGGALKTLRMPDKVIAMDISPAFPGVQASQLPTASQGGKLAEWDETPRLVVGMAGRHVYVYDLVPLRAAIDREARGEAVEERRRASSWRAMCDACHLATAMRHRASKVELPSSFSTPNLRFRRSSMPSNAIVKLWTMKKDRMIRSIPSTRLPSIPRMILLIEFGAHSHGTFASLGGDGVASVWDAGAKKRIRQYPRLESTITAAAFDASGH